MTILTRKALAAGITLGLLLWSGCTLDGPGSHEPNAPVVRTIKIPTRVFAPNRVNIIPLTRFVQSKKPAELDYIRVYAELLDDYQSQIKSPGTFRFELYNRALRSVDPLGTRIEIWKDIALTDLKQNNRYWREFLRTYEFRLDLPHILQGHFILQVTFSTPEGKRLTSHKTIYLGTRP
ncbi:MAG: hypothetical protein GY809_18860 [Planctomycetes bacterium]|nr:hypothetical protein [Planctomycetota bacterium]